MTKDVFDQLSTLSVESKAKVDAIRDLADFRQRKGLPAITPQFFDHLYDESAEFIRQVVLRTEIFMFERIEE